MRTLEVIDLKKTLGFSAFVPATEDEIEDLNNEILVRRGYTCIPA
jgi:hypothetical protein